MSADQINFERRASQRFEFQLPIAVRLAGDEKQGCGFTQDLSGRGAFFYTDFKVAEGDAVELTFVMPSEITLTENMRVRCSGRVTRVQAIESKYGVAVHLEGYEYLSDSDNAAHASASFPKVTPAQNSPQKDSQLSASSIVVEG